MANALSSQLLAQLYGQESNDPFLALLTLSHEDFTSDIYLVNNTVDVVSRGKTFLAFPFRFRFPVDDGETVREFSIDFDNVGLDLIPSIRSVTSEISVKLELVLASLPNDVQITQQDLKIQKIDYNATKISAKLIFDDFLNTQMTSEIYAPSSYPGLF